MTSSITQSLKEAFDTLHIQFGDLIYAEWLDPGDAGLLIYLGIDGRGRHRFLEYVPNNDCWVLRQNEIWGICLKSVLRSFKECSSQ